MSENETLNRAAPKISNFGSIILRVMILLTVIGISAYIFMIRDQAAKFALYGYPGIFLISILANGTILLPAPGIAIVFAMGGVFNPLIVGLVAGAGAAIGELSGYLAGFSGQVVAERTTVYRRIERWMQGYGPLTIFILAAIPNPFFDLAGMAAGVLKMPLHRFFVACLLGKIIKMLIFAYAGAYSINWLFDTMK
ncbi:MAG TPA: VTT domain-containing protein [Anaerolineales bacterium]|nr:VTT domain-containing protein [Anaerolineales bacterium]